jgi:UDP-3-O-[3-hydroxymyristoyl] glucosamine N-acyltransferase
MFKLTVGQIAEAVGGVLQGDPHGEVTRVAPLADAGPGDLTFYAPSAKDRGGRLKELLAGSTASAVLLTAPESECQAPQIIVPHPMLGIIRLLERHGKRPSWNSGVHLDARVDPTAKLAEGVTVGAFSVIGPQVTVGEGSVIHPHVVVYEGAVIGARCTLHSGVVVREGVELGDHVTVQNGAVVGGDGFGYVFDPAHGHRKIPHVGTVRVGDQVEIGANTTVDRATLGETVIGSGSKLDNLVMVGHNVRLGSRVLLCGQVGISGSSSVGDYSVLGGQVGVADHVSIGSQVKVAAKSGVAGDIPDRKIMAGIPAIDAGQWRRSMGMLGKLSGLARRLAGVERVIGSGVTTAAVEGVSEEEGDVR